MKTKLLTIFSALAAAAFSNATEVDAESQRLIGLETAELAAKNLPPEVPAHGSVLAPAPVIDLFRQIDAAREALAISKESLERAETLFSSGKLVSRKDVQAAETQQAKDKAALLVVEDKLALDWGPHFSKMAPVERNKLLEDLLAGRQALIRLSVSRAEQLETAPLAATLHAFGRENFPQRCKVIGPSPSTDPAFQSQAFLGLMETPAAPLAAGLNLTGTLEIKGKPRGGLFVPQDAVVFYLGKAWIYQKNGGDEFTRVEIPVDNPVAGGWFVAKDAVENHPVVTRAAQSLLSKETLSAVEEE